MLTIPGLIDPHVHLRDLGQENKEDFFTGTCAAIAGGFTTVLDMPNNLNLITTYEQLEKKEQIAKKKIVCDTGFYFGSLGNNQTDLKQVINRVFGLKLYLNQTTGGFIINLNTFKEILKSWSKDIPVLVHAEEDILEEVLYISRQFEQKIHVCHISSISELEIILKAKNNKDNVTCGVTPHHLFLTSKDREKLGPYGKVKPFLKDQKDVDHLWNNIDKIDIIESDHAPHSKEEKDSSNPPFGLPNLETTLPLLLNAVSQKRITLNEVLRLCFENPSKIFNIPTDKETKVEINEEEEWIIKNENLFTKCKWSPFNNWKIKGKIKKVYIRGIKVFDGGKILVNPSFGKILKRIV